MLIFEENGKRYEKVQVHHTLYKQTPHYSLKEKQQHKDATKTFDYIMIPSHLSPAYGVFISQLIRYARASSSYEMFHSEGGATFQ